METTRCFSGGCRLLRAVVCALGIAGLNVGSTIAQTPAPPTAPETDAPFEAATSAAVTPPPVSTPTPPPPASTPTPTLSPASSPAVSPTAVASPRIMYPSPGASSVLPAGKTGDTSGTSGLVTTFVLLLTLCGGGYYLLRRQTGFAPGNKGPRKLVVSESRSLGNRQFLVVVEYENERMLLGVTPGKIDYLCPLRPSGTGDKPPEFKLPG